MIKYPKTVIHRGWRFYPKICEGHLRYGDCVLYSKEYWGRRGAQSWGVIELKVGWQDMDRTMTAQDIYWVDKYDCRVMQREAA